VGGTVMEHESRLAEVLLQVSYVVDPSQQVTMTPIPERVPGAVDILAADPELGIWLGEGHSKEGDAAKALMGATILLGPVIEEIVQHRHASRREDEEEEIRRKLAEDRRLGHSS